MNDLTTRRTALTEQLRKLGAIKDIAALTASLSEAVNASAVAEASAINSEFGKDDYQAEQSRRADLKVAIIDAREALDNALESNRLLKLVTDQLRDVNSAIAEAEQKQRLDIIAEANARLARAENTFQTLAVQAAKAYRQLLDAQRYAQHVPGARTNILGGRTAFDVEFMRSFGSDHFPLSEQMRQGVMGWENHMKEAA
jgi:small-conductance mechanosensitive channel